MFIASDFEQYKEMFIEHLRVMLSGDHLGAFILVLANSLKDSELKAALGPDINDAYQRLQNRFDEIRKTAPQDDIDVFEQLRKLELSELAPWDTRREGRWDICLNTIRKLRPARASAQVLSSIRKGYDAGGFNFNKPFLKPEILWQGEFKGTKLRILYNKFPFSDYHLLIAVSPDEERPQLIDGSSHHLIHDLVQDTAADLPGFSVGFNSLAAGASVNHLHFQGFVRQQSLPIEDSCWRHNGGADEYPLDVYRFEDAAKAWDRIRQLIERDIAYNCLYRQSNCFVVPRRYQGTVDLPEWLQGAGWLDMAGVMTVSDGAVFDTISDDDVSESLKRMRLT